MTHTGFFPPIKSYDFHIYYHSRHAGSKSEAIELKNKIFETFQQEIDEDKLIVKVLRDEERTGPHITAFFEVDTESPETFVTFLSWIQYNHGSLSVLVHPNSGEVFRDHTDLASWIGTKLPLHADYLEGLTGYPDVHFPARELIRDGWYEDPEKYKKSIMIRLLTAGTKDKFW